MNKKQKILELAKKMGIIRPRDVEAEGISRMYLHRMYYLLSNGNYRFRILQ